MEGIRVRDEEAAAFAAAGFTLTLALLPATSIPAAILERPAMARIARFVVPGLPHDVT